MKTIDKIFWTSAIVAGIIASTMENPHTGISNPMQGTMFLIAVGLALIPILARVIKANATWGTLGFLISISVILFFIFH